MGRNAPFLLTFVALVPAASVVAQPLRRVSVSMLGDISGFPTGEVSLTGGGAYDLDSGSVHSAGGFSCLADVRQGPLSVSINPKDPGPCLAGQGVRWDTAEVLASTIFKCTGAASESLKTVRTSDTQVVLQADFRRAGDGNDESFTAQMIVSSTDIAPDIPGVQNSGFKVWGAEGRSCTSVASKFQSLRCHWNGTVFVVPFLSTHSKTHSTV